MASKAPKRPFHTLAVGSRHMPFQFCAHPCLLSHLGALFCSVGWVVCALLGQTLCYSDALLCMRVFVLCGIRYGVVGGGLARVYESFFCGACRVCCPQ